MEVRDVGIGGGFGDDFGDGCGDGFVDGFVDDNGGVEGCLSDVEKFQHRIHKE